MSLLEKWQPKNNRIHMTSHNKYSLVSADCQCGWGRLESLKHPYNGIQYVFHQDVTSTLGSLAPIPVHK